MSKKALAILQQVFANAPDSFAISLWDGASLRLGSEAPAFRLRFPSKRALQQLFLHPNVLHAGEAYIRKDFEIEGDLLAAVRLMDSLNLRPSFFERLKLAAQVVSL